MPSYDITETVDKSTISEANGTRLQGFSNLTQKYSIISFPAEVTFITGDAVFINQKQLVYQNSLKMFTM